MKKAALFLILFLFMLPVYSQTGWYWQNPTPQGNILYDISFYDLYNGWAVGAHGTILFSDDQGASWTKEVELTTNVLFALFFRQADDGWVVGEHGTIMHWNGTNWEFQNSGTDLQLHDVFFINSMTGWVVGQNETVLHTTDGGATWSDIGTGGSEHYFSVHFIDENNGYLAGAAGSNGVIRSTTDGGNIWSSEIIPANRMNALCLAGDHTLWAVGDNGAIFYKADAESDWVIQDCGSDNNLLSVSAINSHQVWVAGDGGIIYHSNNDGADWFQEESHVTDRLYSIQILNGESGWAAGDAGTLLHTYNGGGTWVRQSQSGPKGYLKDLSFMYPEWGVLVGHNGQIWSSLDGGHSWEEDSSGVSENIYAVDMSRFYLTQRAIAVGYGGTVLRRFRDGDLYLKPWDLMEADHNYDLYGLDVRGSTAWAAGHWGSVFFSENSGREWQNMHYANTYHLYDVHFASRLSGWAVGMSSTILCTRDRGETWEEQDSPVETNYNSVWFSDIYHGWAVGLNGVIIFTGDQGRTWTEQNSGTTAGLTSVYFTDNNNGWISGYGGTMLHTNNGGETWRKQSTGTANTLFSVYFADPVHGWACGEKGNLLATNDGGGVTTYRVNPRYDIGSPILDLLHTTDTMKVSGDDVKMAAAAEEKVVAVEVLIDSILHTSASDLVITLSHEGVTDTLVNRNCEGKADFVKLKLSDAADMPIDSGASPFQGSFQPYKPLSVFAGLDPEGQWLLDIYDASEGHTGTLEAWSLLLYTGEREAATAVKPVYSELAGGAELFQNFPNPFKDHTTISYYLPGPAEVDIGIYNIMGQLVASFPNAGNTRGKHQLEWKPQKRAGGIYFVRLRSGTFTLYRKMLLME